MTRKPPRASAPPPAARVRLRFAKRGDLRFLGHHDLLRCLERMIRRAELPVARTQGFNPRPRLVFGLALSLGVEGHSETLDIDLDRPVAPEALRQALQAESPPGLDWLSAEAAATGRRGKAQVVAVAYDIAIPDDRRAAVVEAARVLLASATWPVERRKMGLADPREKSSPPAAPKNFDLRPHLLELDPNDAGRLRFVLKVDPAGSARPEDVLTALDLRDLLDGPVPAILARTEVRLAGPAPVESESDPESDGDAPEAIDGSDDDGS